MNLLQIVNFIIISLIVSIAFVYIFSIANLAFLGRVEAAPTETLTPTPKPTSQSGSTVIDLRLAPGCLLPSWTGLCRKATTPTPTTSPTVTPTPTKTQTANLVQSDTDPGAVGQETTKQQEVLDSQAPTIQPKSGSEGLLLLSSLFAMLIFGPRLLKASRKP